MRKFIVLWCFLFSFIFISNESFANNLFIDKSRIFVVFSPHDKIENLIVNKINNAKKEVLLATYSFTSKNIIKSLVKIFQRGVKVKILLDYRNNKFLINKKKFKLFYKYNVPIKCFLPHKVMHNKFIVIDDNFVETGSYNYTISANKYNLENAIFLNNSPKIALKYKKEFLNLWKNSHFK